MGRLFGQSDPNTVLFILFGRTEGDVPEGSKNTNDSQLNIGEVDQCPQQARFVIKEIERVVGPGFDLHDRIGCCHLLEFLTQ